MITRLVRPVAAAVGACALIALASGSASAQQQRVTSPQQHFGHPIGADYVLPDYTAFASYWEKLAAESDRMVLDTIGLTAEGRPQLMAIITSPANHGNLERYRQIAARLARAEGVDSAEAVKLAQEGKGVVWIDGGLHATEVLGAQQLTETVYQLVSGDDAETRRFLDDLVILAVHANPDGMELVSDWYMRESDPKKRSTGGVPRLYQKYVGHDNNRDFFLSSQPESENMNRILYRTWYPQVMYNHHQTGPAGTVMFAPPFRDPANYNLHPLITSGLDVVGSAMMNRFIAEDKPGVTNRSGASYSTWWNGGLRTAAYYHNIIGLLTETIGNPTPQTIPFIPGKQIRSADLPFPVKPQEWRFRQSIDYSVTSNRAVLDLVSRYREKFLFNIWKMGHDAIAAGSQDSWTIWPGKVDAITEKMTAAQARDGAGTQGGFGGRGPVLRGTEAEWKALRTPETRDPRAYVIPADQADFLTATKFVNTLLKNGVDVHRATAPLTVGGKRYPAGSYVVRTAQAFRPQVLDMFEPQDHPHDFAYPGGPPLAPYDIAGWTLALQMGVVFDRTLEGVTGALEEITADTLAMPAGTVANAPSGGGWLIDHRTNDAFTAVNRIIKGGGEVYRVKSAAAGVPQGSFFVPQGGSVRQTLDALARDRGVSFTATSARPTAGATKLSARRIALVDRYGGSMPSGWTRFILERFDFPFEVVYPQQLDAGNLRQKYDVIIFVDGMIPARDASGRGGQGGAPDAATIPAEMRGWLGSITVAKTVPELRKFADAGGTILTIGSSTVLGEHFGLPISNHLVQRTPEGETKELTNGQYYIPGSLLEVQVDSTTALGQGMGSRAIVMFDNSPVYRLGPDAAKKGVRPVAWFSSAEARRSGGGGGPGDQEGGVAVAEADVGRGRLVMFGPEILFRAQPHGTFKLFFNGIYE
ncbi:MAG: M14 family metallopeptidase [Gemmatimonadaceae bacterium]